MAIGFFDGQKADASPESIKRKREMIARLMSGGRAPRNIGEGFSAIGDGIASAMLGYRADSAEQAGNAERSRIMAGAFGGGAPMAAVGGAPVATGRATGSGATSAPVSGKGYDNPQARETYEYALSQGLAPHQAAAYTGAKLAESRFNPNARNPGDGRDGTDSIGGFQWNSGRAQALKQFAAQQGKSWNDPAVQRAFSFAELNGSERAAGQALRNAKTPEEATAAMLSYLRPGGWTSRNPLGAHSAPARLRNTQGILSAFGNMPVVSPGPGAAPMPLARQQAQTAPMPNAGLADMPAPGANQSALEARPVAPVSGDNPQQLLADAAYYEQNGNPEAARQMRERAAMAGQPASEAAFMVPPDGGQTNPLRDMFSARGVGFADNEAETQGFEARMAQEQAAMPAQDPDPVQTVAITPNAQNDSDVFSPIPMGMGRNPFMPSAPVDMAQAPAERPPMDRATFDQITSTGAPLNPAFMAERINPSWGGQNADVAAPGAVEVAGPRQVQAPMPPPRPADLGPQSPFVPPAMRQPMPVDMGGENGASPMQFIESEFARREGRPDPRMAMGAPMAQSPQMPAGAPPMPVGGQSAPMGGAPDAQAQAQAQAQAPATRPGMHDERWLMSVITSPATAQYAPWALETLNKQRATLQAERQAEAERARTQQANEAAARAAGLDPALMGNPVIGKAAAEQRFAKPEGATSDQRELVQVNRERQAAGLPTLRMDEYKIEKARAGASSVNVNTGAKADEKFSEAFAKGDADALGTIATAGMTARRNISRIDRLEELLNASPTGGLAVLQQRAGEFGINTKGLSEIQAAQALINSLVPEQRQPGSGPMSDADLALYKESLVRIINQPDGNKRIIEGLRGIAKYDAEGASIVQQLREGKLNRAQAFEALQNRVNPLAEFSQPRSRTGASAQPGATSPAPAQGGFRVLKVE